MTTRFPIASNLVWSVRKPNRRSPRAQDEATEQPNKNTLMLTRKAKHRRLSRHESAKRDLFRPFLPTQLAVLTHWTNSVTKQMTSSSQAKTNLLMEAWLERSLSLWSLLRRILWKSRRIWRRCMKGMLSLCVRWTQITRWSSKKRRSTTSNFCRNGGKWRKTRSANTGNNLNNCSLKRNNYWSKRRTRSTPSSYASITCCGRSRQWWEAIRRI